MRPGDRVRVTCTATGDEPITIEWRREQGRLPPSVIINDGELLVSLFESYNYWRPLRKIGLTPKTTNARRSYAICNHSISSMVFGVNPLFLEGLQFCIY